MLFRSLRLLERNEQHAFFQMEKDKETHGLSVLDHLALTFGKPSWFELMLWFGTYMTNKDTVSVDRQTCTEVWNVINKIVGKTDSVSLLTSNHADSLSESLRPHLKNMMNSCYEREILLVAEYPREKRQRKEPDDSSKSEPREESEDLYGDFEEIEESLGIFGTWEFGEWSLTTPNPVQSFEQGATSFNLAAQHARRRLRLWQQILLLKLWRNSPTCSSAIKSFSTIVNSSKINTNFFRGPT